MTLREEGHFALGSALYERESTPSNLVFLGCSLLLDFSFTSLHILSKCPIAVGLGHRFGCHRLPCCRMVGSMMVRAAVLGVMLVRLSGGHSTTLPTLLLAFLPSSGMMLIPIVVAVLVVGGRTIIVMVAAGARAALFRSAHGERTGRERKADETRDQSFGERHSWSPRTLRRKHSRGQPVGNVSS